MKNKLSKWDIIIKPKKSLFSFNFFELFNYSNVIKVFVRRDFVVYYKQTILGPLWYIIQPLVNTLVFSIIFGKIAKISTEGVPPYLFYLTGNIAWAYFAVCLTTTSNTFSANASIFGKVYFPRLTVPISYVIIALLQFFLQLCVLVCFILYFYFLGFEINITYTIFLLPFLLFQMALLGLGFGILISSLTTKYRDLTFVMTFGVQLWMFMTPIVYPLSSVPEQYHFWLALNPMTSVIELFREIFLSTSTIKLEHVIISVLLTILVSIIGLINFNRTERNFLDTI